MVDTSERFLTRAEQAASDILRHLDDESPKLNADLIREVCESVLSAGERHGVQVAKIRALEVQRMRLHQKFRLVCKSCDAREGAPHNAGCMNLGKQS